MHLTAGWLAARIRYYGYTGSFTQALEWPNFYLHRVQHELTGFVLLLLVSCMTRKAWWWVAIGRIGYKAMSLLLFYWNTYYLSQHSLYDDGLSYTYGLLHLELVRRIFFQDPLRMMTLPALYAYWLFLCVRILRTPDALPAPRDSNAFVTSI